MKTKSLLTIVLLLVFFMFSNSVNAQTYQIDLHGVLTNAKVLCFEEGNTVSGEMTYHFTYHLNKKGELEWIHYNVLNASLVNDATGEEYIIQYTGHDNCDLMENWQLFNSLNEYNKYYNFYYDPDDGFLTQYFPEVMPDEGTSIVGAFFIKAKKGGRLMATMHQTFQLHRNANGEIRPEVNNSWFECP